MRDGHPPRSGGGGVRRSVRNSPPRSDVLKEIDKRESASVETMKIWVIIFALLSALAGLFAFGGVDPAAAPAARVIFYFFIALSAASIVGWLLMRMR